MYVAAGAPLLRLYNVPLESKVASSASDYAIASLRTAYAAIHYENLGAALQERQQLTTQTREMQEEASNLELRSPIAGTVLTPRLNDWQGAYAREGTELVEVADLSQMRARVYVSDYEMYKLHVGSRARINIEGIPRLWSATAVAITPVSTEIDPGIADTAKYKGLNAQNYYVVDLVISNLGLILKPGAAGVARIYGPRRCLASHTAREFVRFFGRKLW
jgi:multidrug resistance efflux pump